MFTFETGLLPNVDGSVLLQCRQHKMVASSTGPHEIRLALQRADRRARLFVTLRSEGNDVSSSLLDKKMGSLVHSVLSSTLLMTGHGYAKAGCTIMVQKLTASSWRETLTNAINAATLAVLDNGLPIKGLVCAASCVVLEDKLLSEPSPDEEAKASSQHVLAFLMTHATIEPADGPDDMPAELVLVESQGAFEEQEFLKVFAHCKKAAYAIHQTIRDTL